MTAFFCQRLQRRSAASAAHCMLVTTKLSEAVHKMRPVATSKEARSSYERFAPNSRHSRYALVVAFEWPSSGSSRVLPFRASRKSRRNPESPLCHGATPLLLSRATGARASLRCNLAFFNMAACEWCRVSPIGVHSPGQFDPSWRCASMCACYIE